MFYYGHMSGFGWGGMMIFWILFIGLVIWLIWQNQSKSLSVNKTATQILRERYAKGEIGKKEFEEIKNKLQGEK